MNSIGNLDNKNILLLQGPMGVFFKRLDIFFRKRGAHTFRIGFNAGDRFFSNKDNYTPYRSTKNDWKKFIACFLEEYQIDKIFLFGDCRFYHSVAIVESIGLNIDIFVFEEGYIRPDFITMERYGVNDFSHIPRKSQFYLQLDMSSLEQKMILPAHPSYYRMVLSAAVYYAVSGLFRFRYPHYEHHRRFNFTLEAYYAARNAARKLEYKITQRTLLEKLLKQKDNYYFVPLQTQDDYQLREHSHFSSVESFIKIVMHSFAEYAPKDRYLAIKHHPMDRGRKDYIRFIDTLSQKLDIFERIIIIHDLHLPTCLKSAIGTITINSTVGISSLYHHTPVITLGNAIYDIDGLTCKDMKLDDFWEEYREPDSELFEKFRRYLVNQTQLNGSFYGRFPVELKEVTRI